MLLNNQTFGIFPKSCWLCKPLIVFALCLSFGILNAQITSDSTKIERKPSFNRARFWGLTGLTAAGYTATVVGLDRIWYAQYPRGKFHLFNDFDEWFQMDKCGHLITAYAQANVATEAYRWTGIKDKKAVIIGAAASVFFQNTLEVLDGFSEEWGFSPGDVLFNSIGTASYTAQELVWGEQRMMWKYSFHRVKYPNTAAISDNPSAPTYTTKDRAKALYGTVIPEQAIKDYNGITLWLSVNPSSFLKNKDTNFPNWLSFAVGYGAENLYGAEQNRWKVTDEVTGTTNEYYLSSAEFPKTRQLFLAPDIDLTKIKTKKKAVKVLLYFLNTFKFPMPTLEFNSQRQMNFHFLYF